MKKASFDKSVSGATKRVLESVLKLEANSASCIVLYEPKAPEALSKFKKK